MTKKKSDAMPVAVVVAIPVKEASVTTKIEVQGNRSKSGASSARSWRILLFPVLSFLAGVVAPPLRYYVSFQNGYVPLEYAGAIGYHSRYVFVLLLIMRNIFCVA